jgi:subtilisin family serine protease
LLRRDAVDASISVLNDIAGLNTVARTADFNEGVLDDSQSDADVIVFDRLGVAVTTLDAEQLSAVNAAVDDSSNPILMISPERIFYATGVGEQQQVNSTTEISTEYLRGYRDGVVHLVDNLSNPSKEQMAAIAAFNESQNTWGLQVTGVVSSRFTGRGVKVAVLDTGFDFNHPDFSGRTIARESFVRLRTGAPPLPVQDGNGHGTHCIGTACGSLRPGILPRYGIAYDAEIYVGKVMPDSGRGGATRTILGGAEWANRQGCKIISISIESLVRPGQTFDPLFEQIAQRLLGLGSLIIAAAGNGTRRNAGRIVPVSILANCPSVMAVGAVNSQLQIADFSPASINPTGGQIDIVAPGVDVYSSYPVSMGSPRGYTRLNGTSMATPHVAGIAALYAEANPGITAPQLWNLLIRTAQRLPLPSIDVGAGLVQAP